MDGDRKSRFGFLSESYPAGALPTTSASRSVGLSEKFARAAPLKSQAGSLRSPVRNWLWAASVP